MEVYSAEVGESEYIGSQEHRVRIHQDEVRLQHGELPVKIGIV
jgi:hypothetical protein